MNCLKCLSAVLMLLPATMASSQGHIDHIKNQSYLKYKVDCNNSPGDNLSERICANLAFQRSDSLLCIVYDSLLAKAKTHYIDSLATKIVHMQDTWRNLRDQHCAIIYETYGKPASGHLQAIDYLSCLRELTEDRIKELRQLLAQIGD